MAIESLSILTESGEGQAYLAQSYGKVIENVQKGCISTLFKNEDLSGEPAAGSVVCRRFANAEIAEYGTARAGGGKKTKAADVTVDIDDHFECIEEVNVSDTKLFGVEGLVERRLANHQMRLIKYLERKFWAVTKSTGYTTTGVTNGVVDVTGYDDIAEAIDALIVSLETTKDQYVDGVDRDMMGLILSPKYYTALQKYIDTLHNTLTGNTYQVFHEVRVFSSTDLPDTVGVVLVTKGAIAQPIMYTPDDAGKFPASNDFHFGFFGDEGTKLISKELVRTATAANLDTVLAKAKAAPAADAGKEGKTA